MTLDEVTKRDALAKTDFHQRLQTWVAATAGIEAINPTIGPVEPDGKKIGRKVWIVVRDSGAFYGLHSDTPRSAIAGYLDLVAHFGDSVQWTVVEGKKGNLTSVAFGPDLTRVKSFYLYVGA